MGHYCVVDQTLALQLGGGGGNVFMCPSSAAHCPHVLGIHVVLLGHCCVVQ